MPIARGTRPPRWTWTYATLYMGLAGWRRGETKASIRLMEEGLRKADAGVEEEAPGEFAELAGRPHRCRGELGRTVPQDTPHGPLERASPSRTGSSGGPSAPSKRWRARPSRVALQASLLSGDLFVEYGKAILASQRPKGLKGDDREGYEEALRKRAGSFYERSLDRYARRARPARGR